jgi:hypothetical protein
MSIFLFDSPDCVFIRVRKTGSTSVVRGLLGGKRRAAVTSRDGRWNTAFDGQFTFAFVRNPFERMVSALRMFRDYKAASFYNPAALCEARMRRRLDLAMVMDVIEDDTIPLDRGTWLSKLRLHALPMTSPFYHLEKADFIGRFETFAEDYGRIADRLGIAIEAVAHERKGKPPEWRAAFDGPLRARAEALLRPDCEAFGYRFE